VPGEKGKKGKRREEECTTYMKLDEKKREKRKQTKKKTKGKTTHTHTHTQEN
jgi:hypothetical protein